MSAKISGDIAHISTYLRQSQHLTDVKMKLNEFPQFLRKHVLFYAYEDTFLAEESTKSTCSSLAYSWWSRWEIWHSESAAWLYWWRRFLCKSSLGEMLRASELTSPLFRIYSVCYINCVNWKYSFACYILKHVSSFTVTYDLRLMLSSNDCNFEKDWSV